MRRSIPTACLVILTLGFAACRLEPLSEDGPSVVIGFKNAMTDSAKTLWPEGNPNFYTIGSYQITGNDGGTHSYDSGRISGALPASLTIDNLYPGSWTFTAEVWNTKTPAADLIGSGTVVSVPITSGGTATPTLQIKMITGGGASGYFDFQLTVPAILQSSGHSAHAWLYRLDLLPATSIDLIPFETISGPTVPAAASIAPIAAGHYRLYVEIYNSSSRLAWGWSETAFVAKDYGTAFNRTVNAADVNQPPVQLTMTPTATLVPKTASVTLTSPTYGARIAYTIGTGTPADPAFDPATLAVTVGTEYTGPISLATYSGDVTVKAVVYNWWGSQTLVSRTFTISGAADVIIDDQLPQPVAITFTDTVTAGAAKQDADGDGIIGITYNDSQYSIAAASSPALTGTWHWRMAGASGMVEMPSLTGPTISLGKANPSDCPCGPGPLPVGTHTVVAELEDMKGNRYSSSFVFEVTP